MADTTYRPQNRYNNNQFLSQYVEVYGKVI